jgi:hypothetical protein
MAKEDGMGEVADLLAKMRGQRDAILRDLADVPESQLAQVGQWGQARQMPIRLMYYQVVAHEMEHTVQVAKTLAMLDRGGNEARLMLAHLQELRGKLEGLIATLKDEDVTAAPQGEWSIKQTVEHMLSTEASYTGRIKAALEATNAQA